MKTTTLKIMMTLTKMMTIITMKIKFHGDNDDDYNDDANDEDNDDDDW